MTLNMTPLERPRIICRQIQAADIGAVAALLAVGFPSRTRVFWQQSLRRLGAQAVPGGFPQYGYMLYHGETVAGALLLISSAMTGADGTVHVRCNVSSWYVAPAYRNYGAQLASRALSHKSANYLNVSPAPGTEPLLQVQGFELYCPGHVMAAPALVRGAADVQIERFDPARASPGLLPSEQQLLSDHAGFGCLCLVVRLSERWVPLVFQWRKSRGIPHARLIYARDISDFLACAGPVGRLLARRGALMVLLDADGPIRGVPGHFVPAPKYFKGAIRPRLGDLAYTEYAMFGM